MPQFALLNDVKALDKLISKAHKSGEAFGKLLHEAAYNCIAHVVNTGDVRPLQRLHDGLALRLKLALGAWSAKHCPRIKYDTKALSFGVKKTDESTDFAILADISPVDYVPVKAARQPQAFNLKVELEKLLKKAEEKRPDASKSIGLMRQAMSAA